jgi:hypothetical protein
MIRKATFLGLCLAGLCAGAAGCSSAAEDDSGSADAVKGGANPNARLDAAYSKPENWQKVATKVYGWLGGSAPPCATFMSTALEMFAGVPFPKGLGSTITPTEFPAGLDADDAVVREVTAFSHGKYEVRTNTSGLADYLLQRQGWQVIWDPGALLPGDVVFTMPTDKARHPTHTYMFHAWLDQSQGWGWVIDNEADGHCSDGDSSFVEFCGEGGSGQALCCQAEGQHIYKRSITTGVPEPYNPSEIDDPMWFALRAGAPPPSSSDTSTGDATSSAPQSPPAIDAFVQSVLLEGPYANEATYAGFGRMAGLWCGQNKDASVGCSIYIYDGDKASDRRTVQSTIANVTHTTDCSQVSSPAITLNLQIQDDGQGGHDYPYEYDITFDCVGSKIRISSPSYEKDAPDTLVPLGR